MFTEGIVYSLHTTVQEVVHGKICVPVISFSWAWDLSSELTADGHHRLSNTLTL
jgi:hypothetical protein